MSRTLRPTLQKCRGCVAFGLCCAIVPLLLACALDDQRAGKSVSRRPVNDLKLSSGSQITAVEVDKLDNGWMFFRYETKHETGSCAQLSEVRELWKARHVLNQPEAAEALTIMLDPTEPSGRSQGYRYVKRDDVWTEGFSPTCNR